MWNLNHRCSYGRERWLWKWHYNIWEVLDMQPEDCSENELIDINVNPGCDRKDEDVLEQVIPGKKKNLTLKKLSEISGHGDLKGWKVGSQSKLPKEYGDYTKHREGAHSVF